jgi:pSer/pThr/pTyr-binding forkhead associated (FHA) protein
MIGRNLDTNHLSFHDDKTISRKHAELHLMSAAVVNENTSSMPAPSIIRLFVKDLGSKFGTSVNDQKIEANTMVEVASSGTIVKLGGSGCYLRLLNRSLSLCPTRLEKNEKAKLKVRYTNTVIVSSLD